MITDQTLSRMVAGRAVDPASRAALEAEVVRISEKRPGSGQLSADLIVLAGIIVHVCAVVVESARLITDFVHKSRDSQITEVLRRLVAQTGDGGVEQDPTVKRIVALALDVATEDDKKA